MSQKNNSKFPRTVKQINEYNGETANASKAQYTTFTTRLTKF